MRYIPDVHDRSIAEVDAVDFAIPDSENPEITATILDIPAQVIGTDSLRRTGIIEDTFYLPPLLQLYHDRTSFRKSSSPGQTLGNNAQYGTIERICNLSILTGAKPCLGMPIPINGAGLLSSHQWHLGIRPGHSVNVDQAQASAYGHSLRSVHGIELLGYILDMKIDGSFADAQNS